ncbi:MAG: Ribose ABC transport system, permease protein RbsC [uncultured Blastococcus sp.]|uniref:Ribose ABC transport system, permease protein RbsC n=1 Tax=uncultured Blastococcus sp. TaxID=217144 RepID=A0A6J4HHY8_9ACTN|nr:MAG: Ribose ABC transport system, permease protein RbsC [uncultured Blastococcus sp.]
MAADATPHAPPRSLEPAPLAGAPAPGAGGDGDKGNGTAASTALPGRARVSRNADVVQTWASLIALGVLVVVFAAISPQFRTLGNLQQIIDAAAVLAVLATGITFVLLLGAIDLSLPGVIGACAMTVSLLVANSRNDNDLGLLGVGLTIGLGAMFGLLSGVLSTRLRIPTFMTTLGMSAIGIGIATILFGGSRPVVLDENLNAWATSRIGGFTLMSLIAVAAVATGWAIQRWTRVGRYAAAIGGGEDIVALSGVSVARYKALAFGVAGAFYGLGAVMVTARLGSGVVEAGAGLDFAAITAAVIGGTLLSGGRGGVLQSMIGVVALTVLANGLILTGVSPYVQQAVQGVIVVLAVAVAVWPVRHRLGVVK